MSTDMFMGEPGTQLERDCVPFVEMCDDIVDVWDINVSGISEARTRRRRASTPGRLPWQKRIKEVAKKPVLGVGRFTSPDLMVEAIESRARHHRDCRLSISDPFLPKKIDEGRLEDIRECIGCNICISRWEIGGPPLICTQNATAARSTGAAGTWRSSRRPRTPTTTCSSSARARPAWSARWCSASAACRVHLVEAQDDMGDHALDPAAPGLG